MCCSKYDCWRRKWKKEKEQQTFPRRILSAFSTQQNPVQILYISPFSLYLFHQNTNIYIYLTNKTNEVIRTICKIRRLNIYTTCFNVSNSKLWHRQMWRPHISCFIFFLFVFRKKLLPWGNADSFPSFTIQTFFNFLPFFSSIYLQPCFLIYIVLNYSFTT